ncbi:MAG: hypothetical protein AAFR73_12170 [Pseudomonadota bacterium]
MSSPLVRHVRIAALPDATQVTIQISARLLYANAASERPSPDAPIDAPFLEIRSVGTQIVYEVDTGAVLENPSGLAPLIELTLPLTTEDRVTPAIVSARALDERGMDQSTGRWLPVTEALIEVVLHLPPERDLIIAPIAGDIPIPIDWHMETLVEDARRSPPTIEFRLGRLREPIRAEVP